MVNGERKDLQENKGFAEFSRLLFTVYAFGLLTLSSSIAPR